MSLYPVENLRADKRGKEVNTLTRHRPLASVVLSLGLGIAVAQALGLNRLNVKLLWWLALSLLLVGLLFRSKTSTPWRVAFALLVVAFSGLVRYAQQRLPMDIYHQKAAYTRALSGVIENYPIRTRTGTRFVLKPDHDWGRVQVFYDHEGRAPLELHYGDHVRLSGSFQAPKAFEGFDYPAYLAYRGIWAVARVRKTEQIERTARGRGCGLMCWGERWRDVLFARIDAELSVPYRATFKALMFGTRTLLDARTQGLFRDAGVAHVLAVSGLHLGILLGLFVWLFRVGGTSTGWTYAALALLVFVYLLIVGFKVSLVRAALLFGFIALGRVLQARSWVISAQIDPLQGWSAAALLILFLNPQALFDVGFQLSFAATGSLLLFLPLLEPLLARTGLSARRTGTRRLLLKLKRAVASALWVSLAAQLGALPLVAFYFHKLYLGTLASNLLVIPWVTLVLWGGVAFVAALALPWQALIALLGRALERTLGGLSFTVYHLAAIPGMAFDVPGFSAGWVLAYFATLVVLALWLEQRTVHASSWALAADSASATS